MSNQEGQAVRPVFAPASTPTIYADAVVNVANNANIAKFYLARSDPSLTSDVEQPRIIAQVIMPMPAFLNTFIFFEAIVKGLLDKKVVTPEYLDNIRKALELEGRQS